MFEKDTFIKRLPHIASELLQQEFNQACLYLVPTPIGNLGDISLRAILILNQVDIIYAEDTRHSRTLLSHYAINTPLRSLHEHNEITRINEIICILQEQKSVALISDAGMPGISDPGYPVINAVTKEGLTVSALPGACAAVTALAASGFPTDRFEFQGFLATKNTHRHKQLAEISQNKQPVILYEAPHRIDQLLTEIEDILQDRPIVIARELSKSHEEFLHGTAQELRASSFKRKGEFTVIIGPPGQEPISDNNDLESLLLICKQEGLTQKTSVKIICALTGEKKRAVYQTALSVWRNDQ